MRPRLMGLEVRCACTLVAALIACPAAAQSVSGEAGLVSDYRDRGVSVSNRHPALQASLTIEHESGLYANAWGSTLGHGSQLEIDLTAGYEHEVSKLISIDVYATRTIYPSIPGANYSELTAVATAARGATSASLGFSYAPRQHGTRDYAGVGHDNSYVFGAAEYAVPKSPVTLKAGLGYERGSFDQVEHGGKVDWSLGGDVSLPPVRAALAYVGSNADAGGRHALVASLFVSW
jgi:uncharacterized protein (TIGR02001 family)